MKMKITAGILSAVIMAVSLAGCASSAPQEESAPSGSTEETHVISSGSESAEEEVVLPKMSVEVSDKSVTVSYAGENFKTNRFAAGGTMLYVSGIRGDGSSFWGYMEREEDIFRESDTSAGENMGVLNMVVDGQERCQILLMSLKDVEINGQSLKSITYEKCCITVIDREGNLEKEIDISGIYASDPSRPFCFAVDEAGNYYVEHENKLIQIMPDGTQGKIAACDGWIEVVGIGRSGSIYCIYQKRDNGRELARLEGDSFSICDAELPEAPAKYAGIFPGTDSELLLFNKESGVLAFNDNEVEVRVSASEMPVRGETIVGYGILADGRACVVEQKGENVIFHYIPAGK